MRTILQPSNFHILLNFRSGLAVTTDCRSDLKFNWIVRVGVCRMAAGGLIAVCTRIEISD